MTVAEHNATATVWFTRLKDAPTRSGKVSDLFSRARFASSDTSLALADLGRWLSSCYCQIWSGLVLSGVERKTMTGGRSERSRRPDAGGKEKWGTCHPPPSLSRCQYGHLQRPAALIDAPVRQRAAGAWRRPSISPSAQVLPRPGQLSLSLRPSICPRWPVLLSYTHLSSFHHPRLGTV